MMNPAAFDAATTLLARLPAAVVSLSLGLTLEDNDDNAPRTYPKLEALILVDGVSTDWRDLPDGVEVDAWTALYDLQDDLRAALETFSHLLPVDDLLTVTR